MPKKGNNIATSGFKNLDAEYQQELIAKTFSLYKKYMEDGLYDYKCEILISKDLNMSKRLIQLVLDIEKSPRARSIVFGHD